MPTEELAFLPITDLAKRIEAKKLSPVELTLYFLDRSQKLGPRYNAYALLTSEIALAQAKAAEKEIHNGHYRGPLHGIPYAAKDLLAVKGVPCTWGAKPPACHASFRLRRHGNRASESRQRHSARQSVHDRTCGAEWVIALLLLRCKSEAKKSLGHKVLDLRLVLRFRRHRRSRALAPFAIGTETFGSINLSPPRFAASADCVPPTAA